MTSAHEDGRTWRYRDMERVWDALRKMVYKGTHRS